MTDSVRVRIDDETVILVAVEEQEVEGREQVSAKSLVDLLSVFKGIEGFASQALEAIKKVSPTKATLEFSASLQMDSGKLVALVCDGKTTGSIKVQLEWKP